MKFIIEREYLEKCTVGKLTIRGSKKCLYDDCYSCFTLELPYKDNQKNISCIPEGTYKMIKYKSPSRKKNPLCFLLKKVPNRSAIQIHAGNTVKDIRGCILVGEGRKNDGNIITYSRMALEALLKIAEYEEEITLEITSYKSAWQKAKSFFSTLDMKKIGVFKHFKFENSTYDGL